MEHTQNYEDADMNQDNQGELYNGEGSPEYMDEMQEGLIGVDYEDNNEEEGTGNVEKTIKEY